MEVIEAGLERVVVGGAGAAGAGAGSGGCSAVGVSTSGGGFGVVLTFLNDLRAKLLVDGLMEVIEAGLERVVVGGAGAAGAGAGSGGCSAVGVSTSGGGFGVVLTFLNDLRAKLLVDGLMDSTREMADDLWVSLFGRSLAVMTESGLVLVVLLICCSSRKDGLGEL